MASTDDYWPPQLQRSVGGVFAMVGNTPPGVYALKALASGATSVLGVVPVGMYVVTCPGSFHRVMDAIELRALYAERLKTTGGNDGDDG